MDNHTLSQAIKAYITQQLEEAYNKKEQEALFTAQIDERVIHLLYLMQTNPTVAVYIQQGVDSLISSIVAEELLNVKRELTHDEELILDTFIEVESHSGIPNFLGAVESCKKLLKL